MKSGLSYTSPETPVLLILGSLPSDKSIAAQEYYANPQNHFWHIIAHITNTPFESSYASRLNIAHSHGIALWDVLQSAERIGSLDSKIKSPQPNDIAAFIAKYPSVRLIVLNGRKAEEYYTKFVNNLHAPHICVRSSSPIASQSCNTAQEKAALWFNEISKYIKLPLMPTI